MTDIKELLDDIYVAIDKAEAVRDLAPQDKGRYFLVNCPECGHREAFLYKNGVQIQCNRVSKCGITINLWDYVQQKNGFSNQETLQELARLVSYELPDLTNYSDDRAIKIQE